MPDIHHGLEKGLECPECLQWARKGSGVSKNHKVGWKMVRTYFEKVQKYFGMLKVGYKRAWLVQKSYVELEKDVNFLQKGPKILLLKELATKVNSHMCLQKFWPHPILG